MSIDMDTKDPTQSKKSGEGITPADLPPPYTRRDIQPAIAPEAGSSRFPGGLVSQASQSSQPGIQPSNFILISKERGPVKDTFVIDPTIEVAAHTLPPLENNRMPKWLRRPSSLWSKEEEQTRANLILKTKEGSIDAEIYVAVSSQYPTDKAPVRTAVNARSKQGSIVLTLHRDPTTRSSIYVHASSNKGTVVVNLPRSFQGPLKLSSTHGSITRSREITAGSRFLFEKDHVQHIFVGDQSTWTADSSGWKGDEAIVQSRDANVTVRFDDEPDDWGRLVKGVKGFVSWLFGSQ